MRASAAVTVVLPTPPFPATMTSRDWEQNPAGSNRRPFSEAVIRRLATALIALGTRCLAPAAASAQARAACHEST